MKRLSSSGQLLGKDIETIEQLSEILAQAYRWRFKISLLNKILTQNIIKI